MLGFAAIMRFYDLNADPPAFFAKGSQDLTTDGAYLTLHARQAVLFGQWDLFGYHHWTAFKVSLVSGVSYLLFEMFGVSRVVASAAGGVLNLGGILLFIAALWPGRSRRVILLVTLFLSASFMMTTYGRQPFAENGLFFLAGLLFLVYSRWFDALWGKIVVGVLIALCGLLGKGFGFLLGAGPMVYVLMSEPKDRWKGLASVVAPFALIFTLFWLAFYSDQGFFTFLWEHGAGVHGFPHGLASVPGFFEALISFGRYGLHSNAAVVSVVFYFAVAALLFGQWTGKGRDKTILFMLGWMVAWIVVLAPFNYLPLRYLFLLVVPMAVVAADFLGEFPKVGFGGVPSAKWFRLSVLGLVNWLALYYLVVELLVKANEAGEYYRVVWLVLPVAVVMTVAMVWLLRRRTLTFGPRGTGIVLALVVIGVVASEGYQQGRWITHRLYTMEYGNRDFAAVLGDNAVVAGQDGPAFTADSRIRNFPLFAPARGDELRFLLQQYPITHMAISSVEWDSLTAADPSLLKARTLTRFWVRDAIIVLIRVSDLSRNPQTADYHLTDYERADLALVNRHPDSALAYLQRVVAAHPDCRAGLADLYYLSLGHTSYLSLQPLVERIMTALPTDFAAVMVGAIYFKGLSAQNHNQADFNRSQELLARAIMLNPTNEKNLRRLYDTCRPEDRMI
jgi:hypothetical protein